MAKKIPLDRVARGELAELIVSFRLISLGYIVFKNVIRTGPVDIIAIDVETDEVYKIYVKMVRLNQDGTLEERRKLTDKQREMNVFIGKIVGEEALAFLEEFKLTIRDQNGRVLDV
jgi:hypothetical protein